MGNGQEVSIAPPLELLVDSRLGGVPRRYLGRRGKPLMRVADEVRECAVFLCYLDMTSAVPATEIYKPCGTAFLVSVPLPGFPHGEAIYLVTAGHIIKELPSRGLGRKVYIRVNRHQGESEIISVDAEEWLFHPTDPGVDVAVLPASFYDPTQYAIRAIPEAMAATPEAIRREGIGIGDNVFLTGLFINHYGLYKSLPIIRVGNIAMMPEEPIATNDGPMAVFLIEARSVGGLSGSPVFVSTAGLRSGDTGMLSGATLTSQTYWLGLMHGHWDGRLTAADAMDAVGPTTERVNLGIAIVVPVEKILEALNQDKLVAERKMTVDKLRQLSAPTAD